MHRLKYVVFVTCVGLMTWRNFLRMRKPIRFIVHQINKAENIFKKKREAPPAVG